MDGKCLSLLNFSQMCIPDLLLLDVSLCYQLPLYAQLLVPTGLEIQLQMAVVLVDSIQLHMAVHLIWEYTKRYPARHVFKAGHLTSNVCHCHHLQHQAKLGYYFS